MNLTDREKADIKTAVRDCFQSDPAIRKVVLFGSFVSSDSPNDLDIAVFGDGFEAYLPLALEYRRRVRGISRRIPVDVFPIREDHGGGPIMEAVARGEVIYERGL